MTSPKRLYIFTGKGGVGKTTLSLAFTKYLQDQNLKAVYTCFETSKLEENSTKQNTESLSYAKTLGIQTNGLELISSAQNYIAKKLNSPLLAGWIVKTPFFKSLLNMIPGFNYLIYLGQIMEDIQADSELIYVLDAPSSGHALTMLEAPYNFNEIFSSGILNKDTSLIKRLMLEEGKVQINIITLPTMMSVNEALELKASIDEIAAYNSCIYANNVLYGLEITDPSDFLKSELDNEKTALGHGHISSEKTTPYSTQNGIPDQVKELLPLMKNLV